jgi:hypothetical protein
MVRADLLPIEHLGSPHACKLQVLGDILVHQARDVQYGIATAHGKGLIVVGRLARRLGINTHDFQRTKKKRPERIETIPGFCR